MKISIIIVVVALLGCIIAVYKTVHNKNNNYGTVIVLNGPSGAGKSSAQKAFQQLMLPNLWIKLGIDALFDLPMPDILVEDMARWQSSNPIRWIEEGVDNQNKKIITLGMGADGDKVAYGMNSAIAAYAQTVVIL